MGFVFPQPIRFLGHFVTHIVVGSLVFVVVAATAFGIWEFTQWIKGLGAPQTIWLPCEAIGYLIFWIDAICATFFYFVEGWKLLREIAYSLQAARG